MKPIYLLICIPLPWKHISLVIYVPLPRKYILLVICVPLSGKHIIMPCDMFFPTWETQISLVIVVFLVISVPPPEQHISIVICFFPTQETHIHSDMSCPTYRN